MAARTIVCQLECSAPLGEGFTSLGSRCRQYATNSRNALENGPSSVGGGFFGMRKSTYRRTVVSMANLSDHRLAWTNLHRMQFSIRWLPFGQLNGRDSQTPDVGFVVIPALLNDFGRHPIRCTHEGILLG